MRLSRFLLLAACVLALSPSLASAGSEFSELEAAGARIRAIRVQTQEIFDLTDPAENNALFRLANRLHARTKPQVVLASLPFKEGDLVRVAVLEEAERLLRADRKFFDVSLRAVDHRDGMVDIEILTRDTWALEFGLRAGRSGGENTSGVTLADYNLFGRGMALSLAATRDADRDEKSLELAYPRAFDGHTTVKLGLTDASDGHRREFGISRPFPSLDATWAAGLAVQDDVRRIERYDDGRLVAEYEQARRGGELYGGWSAGRSGSWTHRYSAGLLWREERLTPVPVWASYPQDAWRQTLAAPFARYEFVEDAFERRDNRNLMGRPEFFSLGLAGHLRVGRSAPALGGDRARWLYDGALRYGHAWNARNESFAELQFEGQQVNGADDPRHASFALRHYLTLSPRWLLYAALQGEAVKHPNPAEVLEIGGDNGLRGYPRHYQSGERRLLFTAEARAFSDLYLFRLFRVGAVAFFDVGSAWDGPWGAPQARWRRDVGIGLRVVSVRSAFGNVLHIDLAHPLERDGDLKSLQLLLKSRTSF